MTSVARLARLPDRPAAPVARDGRAAVAVPPRTPGAGWTPRGPVGAPPAPGRGTYAESAYAAAGAAVRAEADETVEVSARFAAGGGRLTIARRTAGGETVGIEAQVA